MKVTIQHARKVFENTGGGIGPVDLRLDAGSFNAILGPSGCGKSTLLRVIAGIESLSEGALTREGNPNDISFVFQEPALLPWKTVLENITLPLNLRNADPVETRARADHWMKILGLLPYTRSYPHELSGGLKMRVSFARALITSPRLILLDEPFSALDEPIRIELALILREIWKEMKPTIVLVTHSITEAVWIAERVLVMKGRPGKIVHDNRLDFGEDRPLSIRGKPEFHRYVEFYFNLLKGSDQ